MKTIKSQVHTFTHNIITILQYLTFDSLTNNVDTRDPIGSKNRTTLICSLLDFSNFGTLPAS